MFPSEESDKEYLRDLEDQLLELLTFGSSETIFPAQMGMADGSIKTDQLSTSSCRFEMPNCADRARLDQDAGKEGPGAWLAEKRDWSPWIQVNFGKTNLVSGVITQGRSDGNEWVTAFSVEYSPACEGALVDVNDDAASPTIFKGNTDSNTKVTNVFPKPVLACIVRISPLEWQGLSSSMRFDLIGDVNAGTPQKLGMEDGRIPDDRLSASSCYYKDCATLARLNQPAGAWTPGYRDKSPWVQADLGTDYLIEGVITQGGGDDEEWVVRFRIQYKRDGASSFEDVVGMNGYSKLFTGNTDANTEVTNLLPTSVVARYVRILPNLWRSGCSLRFELLGAALHR
ncbi:lactadherin-like [Diadema antillarum]|uniref:lactadherin-like n=1 Tax=Diadema antillarum TaxID=105358 RepID=UPI003A8A2603